MLLMCPVTKQFDLGYQWSEHEVQRGEPPQTLLWSVYW